MTMYFPVKNTKDLEVYKGLCTSTESSLAALELIEPAFMDLLKQWDVVLLLNGSLDNDQGTVGVTFKDPKTGRYHIGLNLDSDHHCKCGVWDKVGLNSTLVHELTHVKQILRGDLAIIGEEVRWKGVFHKHSSSKASVYYNSPWEIEAFEAEWKYKEGCGKSTFTERLSQKVLKLIA